jgi:anhydro-N-acetylmuramic acid kinase
LTKALYIGLMSGTSIDGVDAVLASFDTEGKPCVIDRSEAGFPQSLRDEFLDLNHRGMDELARSAIAANALAVVYAEAVKKILASTGLQASQIAAIGAHGQTVRHQPAMGYTVQLNAPAYLAELTGVAVIADFRSRDVAAGGQGAPLVPMFHADVFASAQSRAILNLGGIGNVTILNPGHAPIGFDTGPANVLMDLWCEIHTGKTYDKAGDWGASGVIQAGLLEHLIESEPWFLLDAPKSTGRDLFHRQWLESRVHSAGCAHSAFTPQDVQATLRALTAKSATDAIKKYAPDAADVLVCGGGARNAALMSELQQRLPCPVYTTEHAGIATQDVEALAFAWLAWAHQQSIPAGNPAVTGARGARILGATWPA